MWLPGCLLLMHLLLLCTVLVHLCELTPLLKILFSQFFLVKILPNLKSSHLIPTISNLTTS